jgi:GNAT superfamily N-acetyltransferase
MRISETASIETITSSESFSKNSLTIATATVDDLHLLGQMGTVFAEMYGAGLMNFDPKVFRIKMMQFMSQKLGTVLCAHENFELRGAIAGVIYENVFDGGPCASELFWYVWPGAPKGTGHALLEAFEEWAKRRGCTRVTMAYMLHNMPERLASYYERHGYRPFETHYVKLI